MAISNLMTPHITTSAHAHTTYDGTGTAMGLVNTNAFGAAGPIGMAAQNLLNPRVFNPHDKADEWERRIALVEQERAIQQEKQVAKATRRIVKVIIVDTDENVPLEKCILYSGDEKMTDATDQELFFEIDIKNILDKHNEYRITLTDKAVKERIEKLEPVKIRDLRMVVVNVASF